MKGAKKRDMPWQVKAEMLIQPKGVKQSTKHAKEHIEIDGREQRKHEQGRRAK